MAVLPPARNQKAWSDLVQRLSKDLQIQSGLSKTDIRSVYADLMDVWKRGVSENLEAQAIRNNMSAVLKAIEEEAHPGIRNVRGGRSVHEQILKDVPRDQLAEQIKAWKLGEKPRKVSDVVAELGVRLSPEELANLEAVRPYQKPVSGDRAVTEWAPGIDHPVPPGYNEPPGMSVFEGEGRQADPLYEAEIEGQRGLMRGAQSRKEMEILGRRAHRTMQQAGGISEEALASLPIQQQRAWIRLQNVLDEESETFARASDGPQQEWKRPPEPDVERAPFHDVGMPEVGAPPKDAPYVVPDRPGLREPWDMAEWKRQLMEMRKSGMLSKDVIDYPTYLQLWNARDPRAAAATIGSKVGDRSLQEELATRLRGGRVGRADYAAYKLETAARRRGSHPAIREMLRAVNAGDAEGVKAAKRALEATGDPGISLLLKNLKQPAARSRQLLKNVPKIGDLARLISKL